LKRAVTSLSADMTPRQSISSMVLEGGISLRDLKHEGPDLRVSHNDLGVTIYDPKVTQMEG